MYEYPAEVLSVVDGDTLHSRVTLRDEVTDLGCDVRMTLKITIDLTLRLFGIDTPEMKTKEGHTAKDWLMNRLRDGGILKTYEPLTINTIKDKREKYGRYLAILIDKNGNINQALIEAGQAVPYDGGAKT